MVTVSQQREDQQGQGKSYHHHHHHRNSFDDFTVFCSFVSLLEITKLSEFYQLHKVVCLQNIHVKTKSILCSYNQQCNQPLFQWGNWKQWQWKLETENGNGQHMYTRVKPLIYDYLPLYNDHLCPKTT